MKKIKLVFFGSFQHYSSKILEALIKSSQIDVVAVVTTPPKPAGRKKKLKKTHVHEFALKNKLKVFTPDNLPSTNPKTLFSSPPDIFLTAGYGKILPTSWLKYPKDGSLNLHFSILPYYRGACPAEWALLDRKKTTGITLIEMNEKVDQGGILAVAVIPISDTDTRITLYEKLYQLGAEKLPKWIIKDASGSWTTVPQAFESPTPYAKRLKRQDAFISWKSIKDAMKNEAVETRHSVSQDISLKVRALAGFPGVWTLIPTKRGEKRMKVLSCRVENEKLVLEKVQIEGQKEANWNQVKNVIW